MRHRVMSAARAARSMPCDTVGYVRVSTEEQARAGVSLDAQEERVRAYCLLNGLTLTTIYRDEGVSASKPMRERPEGARLLATIEAGEAQHVVSMKLDRLFRDAVDCLETVRQWDSRGLALHLIDMGGSAMNTASAAGRFFLTVMAGAAEMERNLVRERTRLALAHKRERGDRLGTTPLGFSTPSAGLPMVPNPDEMEAVRVILLSRVRRQPISFRAIAADLAARGLSTKRGGRWQAATVKRIWDRRSRYASMELAEEREQERT
jgi:site-specific DNA recombinase